jgi:hypothetical protein
MTPLESSFLNLMTLAYSCNMTMTFTEKGIDVDLKSDNPNSACGFGHGVDSQGFYYKLKGKIPKKEEILKER